MRHMLALGVILTSILCLANAFDDCTTNEKGQIKIDEKRLFFCTGSRWKPLLYQGYGEKSYPGFSCKDIKDYKGKEIENGIYWIKLKDNKTQASRKKRESAGKEEAFQVYCDMANGGWTMVFKAVGGVDKDVYELYADSDQTSSENETNALDVTNTFMNHYKNRIVLNWGQFCPSEVRVVLYKDGILKKELTFKGTGTDKKNWFCLHRLKNSSWPDIQTENKTIGHYFSIQGSDKARRFFINRNYGGCCNDAGWMVVTRLKHCHWENHYNKTNVILYSKLSTYTNWNEFDNVEEADVLVVYVR